MTGELNVGEAVPAGEGWFDQWLNTGTVAQRSVEIYGRPDYFAEFEALERELSVAKEIAESGEKMLGDTGVDTIEAKIEDLYAKWQASKTTWFIRALTAVEIEQIKDDCGFPDDLPDDADKAAEREHEKANEKANTKANHEMVARALVKVQNPSGETVKESITPAEVEQLHARLGDTQILRLVAAAMVAMTQEVSIPVPLSRKNSKNARNS